MRETGSKKFCDGSFTLPNKLDLSSLLNGDEKVTVVSIVGQSNPEEGCDKTAPLKMMLGRSISSCSPLLPITVDDSLVYLEGWYDCSRSIVFLHLVAAQDLGLLTSGVLTIEDLFNEKHPILANSLLEQQYQRALLLVFSLSHIVLWCHTSHTFDTANITTLRTVNTLRLSVLPHVTSALKTVTGAGRLWENGGRLCCPRLLFLFSSSLLDADWLATGLPVVEGEAAPSAQDGLRAVEQGLEDQIYRLLRRTWIITNNCTNSVAALPSSEQYVYMLSPHQLEQSADLKAAAVLESLCDKGHHTRKSDQYMRDLCSVGLCSADNVSSVCEGGPPAVGAGSGRKKRRPLIDVLSSHLLSEDTTDPAANTEHRFSTFLMQHVLLASTSGFDDNIGRDLVPHHFVLPKLSTWFAAANKLYSLFVQPEKDPQCSPSVVARLTVESPQLQLMRLHCQEAYEEALGTYNASLPQHYPLYLHQQKLREALLQYERAVRSCNPFYSQFLEQLRQECEQSWQTERQGCEQLSLTGHTCEHGRNDHPTVTIDGQELLSHRFGTTFQKYCNCGRTAGLLRDSAVLRYINYDLYKKLSDKCCHVLEQQLFPSQLTGPAIIHVQAQFTRDATSGEGVLETESPATGLSGISAITDALSLHQEQQGTTSRSSDAACSSWLSIDPAAGADVTEPQDEMISQGSNPAAIADHLSQQVKTGVSDHASELSRAGSLDLQGQQSRTPLTDGRLLFNATEGTTSQASHVSDGEVVDLQQRFADTFLMGDGEGSDADHDGPSFVSDTKPQAHDYNSDCAEAYGRGRSDRDQVEDERCKEEDQQLEQEHCLLQMEPMLCSASPAGFLPSYSAWSLVCVGPSSLYSHSLGIIDQPGFLSSRNHLLPWDVRVKANNKNDWSSVVDAAAKKAKGKLTLANDEFFVKVFLGLEYECSSYGHRFLLSSPTSAVTWHHGQSAHTIASTAMPLYHSCLCSNVNDGMSLGQLTRIHVITPKCPVSIVLNPQVQPGPAPCPTYFPQELSSDSIKLSPSSYWVLRLPSIYVNDTGPYYPPDPSQPVGVENGCLLPGCFSITEPSNLDK